MPTPQPMGYLPRLRRLDMEAATAHQGDGTPDGSPLGWSGARHMWNARFGHISPEVLTWLQGDPLFDTSSDIFAQVSPDFKAKRSNVKSEEGKKFIMSGHLGCGCASSVCCTLKLDSPLPFARFHQWFRAFRLVNQDVGGEAWFGPSLLGQHLA